VEDLTKEVNTKSLINEAIILAGGLGTRLRSAVPDLPKCMAPVAGRPFLAYVIDELQAQGVERFIFSLGYISHLIVDFVNAAYPMLDVVYSIEDEPLGTGGAIKMACQKVVGKNVLVLNGDTLFKVDLNKLTNFHIVSGSHCTLSLKPMENFDRYGVVNLNSEYKVTSFLEKQHFEAGNINGGVYALRTKSILQLPLGDKFSFEKDYLEKYFSIQQMYGFLSDAYFIDIGIPEDFQRANQEF
jgi:D-glycero-alpha-D-manno-heptose 1-phosphate guanylyltransferase